MNFPLTIIVEQSPDSHEFLAYSDAVQCLATGDTAEDAIMHFRTAPSPAKPGGGPAGASDRTHREGRWPYPSSSKEEEYGMLAIERLFVGQFRHAEPVQVSSLSEPRAGPDLAPVDRVPTGHLQCESARRSLLPSLSDHNAAVVIAKRGIAKLLSGDPLTKPHKATGIFRKLGPERSEVTPGDDPIKHGTTEAPAQWSQNQELSGAIPETPTSTRQASCTASTGG